MNNGRDGGRGANSQRPSMIGGSGGPGGGETGRAADMEIMRRLNEIDRKLDFILQHLPVNYRGGGGGGGGGVSAEEVDQMRKASEAIRG